MRYKDTRKFKIAKKTNHIVKWIAVIFLVGICLSCSSKNDEIVCELNEDVKERKDTYWIQYDGEAITMYKHQIRLDYVKLGVPKEDLEQYAKDIKKVYEGIKITYSYKFEDELFIETVQVKMDDNFEELVTTGVFGAYISEDSKYFSKEIFLNSMDKELYTCK